VYFHSKNSLTHIEPRPENESLADPDLINAGSELTTILSGGGMNSVSGARRVIIAMEHTAGGEPKILKQCIAPNITVADVLSLTEASLIVDSNCKVMAFS